ncbi:hypothetical protein JW710_04550 [Candidatus Dojkabacteria bacterium]|nr:hypothetical protein [Candidatus Dojkabacteria bacterium]
MPNVSQWLIDIGISNEVLLILCFVPIFVTTTTISRYITGIKTFGIYSPMILSFAYYFMGARQAVTITILVVVVSWATRNILKKTRLHYLSRLSLVYTMNCIAIMAFIAATSFIPSDNPVFDFRNIQPLPLAMIISITDRFVSNYIKKNLITATRLTAETILISLLGWAIMRINIIRNWVTDNIWLSLVALVINYAIGKYSGTRWIEYLRFFDVIKSDERTD